MSKISLRLLLVSVLLLLLSTSFVAVAQDNVVVCAIVPTTEIEYFATLLNEYVMAGEARGIEVITVDSQNDPAREADSIENCIARGVDVIVASVIDPATSEAAATEAMAAGIPFLLQGQERVDVDWATANFGYSEADMGRLAGELVATCLNERYPDAESITVGACGWPQWPSTVRRIDASKVAVEAGVDAEIVWAFEQECGTRELGDQAVSTALQAHPEMRAVVSINDGSSLGAIAAFEAAGIDPAELCIAAPNNDLEVRQYIADGRIYGTVDLNHRGIAEAAMDLVLKVMAGEAIPDMTYVDMIPVTAANVGQWMPGGEPEATEIPIGAVSLDTSEPMTICAIVPTTEIEYFATLLNEYVLAGEAMNVEVITIDSQNDPAREADSIENCIARGVDVIVASVIDPATSEAAATEAMAAGIPFLLQGQERVDVDWATANFGYSEADMGRLAGELVATCLNERYPDAESITVGACGWPQWPSTVRRIDASKVAVETGVDAEIVWAFEQECGTRELGDQAVSTALQAHPEMRAVVSINDGSSLGAIAAFEAAGIDPAELCIAAPNNDLEVRQYIADGRIYGTVDLNHRGIAEAAMQLVRMVGAGMPIPEMTYVDMIPVTAANVGDWPTN